MDQSCINLSELSTKSELLKYLDEVYLPTKCAIPKHKYPYSDICLDKLNEPKNDGHCIYQLLCLDCKRKNSYDCTSSKHKTVSLIETLISLIEQTESKEILNKLESSQKQSENAKFDDLEHQLVLNMQSAIQEIQKVKAILDEQILNIENQKNKIKNDKFQNENSNAEKIRQIKQLLVQILKQESSEQCQKYLSQLNQFTDIDEIGQIKLDLDKKGNQSTEFVRLQLDYFTQLRADIDKWAYQIPINPENSKIQSLQLRSQVQAVFSYLVNECDFGQQLELKLMLNYVDQFNQKSLQIPTIQNCDYHRKYSKITGLTECINLIGSLCCSPELPNEYLSLIKFLNGFCYLYGIGKEKNEKEGFRLFLESDACMKDKDGYAVAQDRIGHCYDFGKGIQKDQAIAFEYYRIAAQQGHAGAYYNLGVCYDNGDGVQKDQAQAVKCYLMAAKLGDSDAQYNLGLSYKNGDGVEKDQTRAIKYYKKSAKQGHPDAQYNLGVCYHQGTGVQIDWPKAVQYYRRAAKQGYPKAYLNLGYCYDQGEGVEKDCAQAVKYYKMAAEQGNAAAQFNLGLCYKNGTGVEENLKEAQKFFKLAADQGDQDAQKYLEKLQRC